jgi:hypothetical protein
MTPRGYILYRGPSLLNGAPIVLVAIMHSMNDKTGDVVQTYILADNGERPTQALKSGSDFSICGDCKHRPVNSGGCYVVVRQGATRVWLELQAGKYADLSRRVSDVASELYDRTVRVGTYGDPAAVPVEVWRQALMSSRGWVGYTHQWRDPKAQPLRYFCMASVDTPEEKLEANDAGWRTFRVRLPGEQLLEREAICPASQEGGYKLNCIECGVCDGALTGRRGNVAIVVHGAKGPHQPVARYTRWREAHREAA